MSLVIVVPMTIGAYATPCYEASVVILQHIKGISLPGCGSDISDYPLSVINRTFTDALGEVLQMKTILLLVSVSRLMQCVEP